jgi:biotin synthase
MQTLSWDYASVEALFELPFMELIYNAYTVHRAHFKTDEMELCTLVNIKTGACPEDCGYCSQSAHYDTGLKREKLSELDDVLEQARAAKANGSHRLCMGAAWRNPPKKDFPKVLEMIKAVKAMGLETCVTLGMLDEEQATQLKEAGLDYYNHNLDTSPEHYKKIITTRTYDDRLQTLQHVRDAGINVCSGAILGMGEARKDRIELLLQFAKLPKPPESIPINNLMPMEGTPLANTPPIENFEFMRTIAVARIMMPTSVLRLSAGRVDMTDEMQTLCFMAGANSIFYGEKLLTTRNPDYGHDMALVQKLGLKTKSSLQGATAASFSPLPLVGEGQGEGV